MQTLKRESTVIFHKNMNGDTATPDKIIGPEGKQSRIWVKKEANRQVSRIEIDGGFDWRESIKPLLPNQPDWCPMTHFGYIESGKMGIQMKDSNEIKTISAGETYYVPPGHIPIVEEDTVMVEFSQDTTYTSKEFLNSSGPKRSFLFNLGLGGGFCSICKGKSSDVA